MYIITACWIQPMCHVLTWHTHSCFHTCSDILELLMIKIILGRRREEEESTRYSTSSRTDAAKSSSLMHSTEMKTTGCWDFKKMNSSVELQWTDVLVLPQEIVPHCLVGSVERFLSIHLFLGGENREEVIQTRNTLSSRREGFTQQGVKPNWLCFIAQPARGKWRSEECVCRCYRVLSMETLLYNGLRVGLGQNYRMWEHWKNCVQSFMVKLS